MTASASVSSSILAMQSPHRDVLQATPDNDDSRGKLIDELQSRGRAAVGHKSWMDAKLLYEKALEVVGNAAATTTSTTTDESASSPWKDKTALLQSNLSLVHKNMGNWEEARVCASKATEADPMYVKGWWRLGQALQSLHRSAEALEALQTAKDLDPTNKALMKEYEKVEKKVAEEAKLVQEASAMDLDGKGETSPTMTTKATSTTTTKATTTTTKPNKTSSDKTKTVNDDDTEDNIFSKSDAVRGYKVVNGKKTSYFHNELDEKTKNLIGDIAPKKLEPNTTTTTTSSPPPQRQPSSGSAWNQAGTWEEKNVTKWAKESLQQQLMQTTFVLPDSSPVPGALVTVTKIKQLEGHASVALARGKKRYIYEFLCKLEWQINSHGNDEHQQHHHLDCKGSLAIPDIDGTIDLGEGYEIHDFVIESVSDNSVKPLIDRFVHRGGFHEALNESIDDWVRLFKKEY